MRMAPAALAGCLLVVAGLPIRAQAPPHPNLSGVGKSVSFTPAPPIPAFEEDLTIEQSADALVITHTERSVRPPALIIVTTYPDKGRCGSTDQELKEVLSLDVEGYLVIERTDIIRPGLRPRLGDAVLRNIRYKKASFTLIGGHDWHLEPDPCR